MHIMGGFGVASLVSAILAYIGKPISFKKLLIMYTLVAIAWETYEYASDIAGNEAWNGWFDTIKDYVNGLLGTAAAYFFIRK